MVESRGTIFGIAFLARTCKAFVKKGRKNKKSPSSKETQLDRSESNEDIFQDDQQESPRKTMKRYSSFRSCNNSQNNIHDPTSPRRTSTKRHNNKKDTYKHKRSSDDDNNNNNNKRFPSKNHFSSSHLSRNYSGLLRSTSRNKSSTESSSTPHPPSLSRVKNLSRQSSNGIMFSNSSGILKPPPIERKLECTLEDLCYGVHKKIRITRDVVKDSGIVVQEEELLTIKVKPGWKKGTKIRFGGMGNEKPGLLSPADIIFVISEKRHSVFRREGDDLEIAVEIPLVQALTGCHLSIPLLGGDKMSLNISDDVIYPGFEKVVRGQGMPVAKEQGRRGDLRVTFLVDFPKELTEEQRLDIIGILQDSR